MIELNLLPPTERATVLRAVTVHFFTILLLFVVVCGATIFAFVGQGWIFLHIHNDALAQSLSVEQSTNTAQETQSFEDAAKKTNVFLTYAEAVTEEPQDDDASLVLLVSSFVPDGVHLHSFTINSISGTMTIGGIADTRDALLVFQQKLQDESGYFTNVQSPLSNLLSPSNIPFSFLVTLKR